MYLIVLICLTGKKAQTIKGNQIAAEQYEDDQANMIKVQAIPVLKIFMVKK